MIDVIITVSLSIQKESGSKKSHFYIAGDEPLLPNLPIKIEQNPLLASSPIPHASCPSSQGTSTSEGDFEQVLIMN